MSEATGPNHEGCKEEEISTTEAEEEVTTAEMTTMEPEEASTIETSSPAEDCNSMPYRCCPDGKTPAAGPGK